MTQINKQIHTYNTHILVNLGISSIGCSPHVDFDISFQTKIEKDSISEAQNVFFKEGDPKPLFFALRKRHKIRYDVISLNI